MIPIKDLEPMKLLRQMKHRYPDVFDYIDKVRGDARYKGLWDHSRSYTSPAVLLPYICQKNGCTPETLAPERAEDLLLLEALAGWRPCKNMYDFDPDLTRELYRQAGRKLTLSSGMVRLPCWCLYIRPNGTDGDPLYGQDFFVYWSGGKKDLYFFTMKKLRIDLAFFLHIGDEDTTLDECIRQSGKLQEERYERAADTQLVTAQKAQGEAYEPEMLQSFRDVISRWLTLVLYLTAVNAEVVRDSAHFFRRSRKIADIPREVEILHVGEETGLRIRTLRRHILAAGGSPEEIPRGGHHRSPVMHLRRAHWHTYRTGSRKLALEKRKAILKWLPPIMVNSEGQAADVVTIEQVKRGGKDGET